MIVAFQEASFVSDNLSVRFLTYAVRESYLNVAHCRRLIFPVLLVTVLVYVLIHFSCMFAISDTHEMFKDNS